MSVPRLYDLQQVDTAISQAAARRSCLDDGTQKRAEVAALVEDLSGIQARLAGWQGRLRTLDLEVQSLNARRAKVEADLYSGRVGNPKELAAMQDEIAAFDRHKAGLEEEMLALMEEVERAEPRARQVQSALEAAHIELARQEAAFAETAAASDREIAGLTTRRAALEAEVDEDLLRRYDRLREPKGGLVVVAVTQGICEGCHVVVPEGRVQRIAQDPEALVACDGCGRLLVLRP